MTLILFGFKSCGKTYFAQKLSEETKEKWIDTDDLIRSFAKSSSISEIYQTLGEKTFRDKEEEIIAHLTPCPIIALGGGALLRPANQKRLQNLGRLVYLQANFETIAKRILKEPLPAFLDSSDPFHSLKILYQERTLLYRSLASFTIDVDKNSERAVLQTLKKVFYGL